MKKQLDTMEKQMGEWGAKIDELAAKAETVGAEFKDEQRFWMADLKAKYQIARARLDEAATAGGERMSILQDGLDGAWSELAAAVKKMTHN